MTSAKYCLVDHAEWNEEQIYRTALRSVETGKVCHEEAELFVCVTGTLSVPTFPKGIGGRERFNGALFHSARWYHDISLSKKRVGLIGSGRSA